MQNELSHAVLSERVFVTHHVRRIAFELHVDEAHQDLAVFAALDALRTGCQREVAITVGVRRAMESKCDPRHRERARVPPSLPPRPVKVLKAGPVGYVDCRPKPTLMERVFQVIAALMIGGAIFMALKP